MRTFLCSISSIFLFCIGSYAQNSPDCRSAIPVCADGPIFSQADGLGDVEDFDPDLIVETGCLQKGSVSEANIENNTSWYVFRAGTDGQLGFDIEALPVPGSSIITAEWDFAVYGPDVDCADISNGTAQPIRCNYENNGTAFTGVGVNPENGQEGAPPLVQNLNTYDEWLDVREGEVYFILINNFLTNFNGDPEPFSLTFTGSSVDADQNTALDCTLRDEFLGLDIVACEGDPDIVLSALRSPAGPDIASVTWSVDADGDGIPDTPPLASGPTETEYVVTSPNSGLYFVEIITTAGVSISDEIQITFLPIPVLREVVILDDISNSNNIRIEVEGNSDYEYAINGGEFQDSNVFIDVPPGENTVIINDLNGCGITEPIPFLVVGYPKFFTPNADGLHDSWHILGVETLTDPTVFIFDRYGKLLKQLTANTPGWDGTFNGRPMPSSDYWFKFDYSRQENGMLVARTVRTHFTLKR
ncbi:T9SS type B sorting domain-containing protein [Spongiimicrobium salis]|uniref:T9SS type B sorting domain-containing protein n=1 Tax=Spongiimicrobium salis TaxID=1667022 RepID=UPI00374C9252